MSKPLDDALAYNLERDRQKDQQMRDVLVALMKLLGRDATRQAFTEAFPPSRPARYKRPQAGDVP